MLSKQSSHTLPIADNTPLLVGSGAEKAISELIGNTFAYKANMKGKVTDIDDKNQIISIAYEDGTTSVIDLSVRNVKNSGGG